MTKNFEPASPSAAETVLTHGGRQSSDHFGFVNTPVFRGSTVLFNTLAELEDYGRTYRYGRNDNPTMRGFAAIVSELEGAAGTVLASSGLSAVTTALLSVLDAGDELLVTDSAYEPTRNFCTEILKRFGVSTQFYDPRIGSGIAGLITRRTKAVFVESPGSLTMEVQDLPAIIAAARPAGLKVIVDNSWATPLYFNPLALGADLVVHAATKMFVGHSDAMLGTVSANEASWPALARTHRRLGVGASPDDAYLGARGARTLAVRMKEHGARSIALAQWLEEQPAIRAVFHPALPSHPDHAVWKRDFRGSGSLFSVLLEPAPRDAVAAMVDNFALFGMGYSWGGYESLCLPFKLANLRTANPWTAEGNLFRVHVGFEDMDDLKRDLQAGLDRYQAANTSVNDGVVRAV